MPLFLSDDQAALLDTARPFMAEQAPVGHMRALRDANDATGFSRDLWRAFAEMGFTGMLVDEAYGGLGLDQVEAGIVLEEIGRNLTPSPFLSTSVGAVTALAGAEPAEQARWLPAIVAGDVVAALAIDEGARHRPAYTALKAERVGNDFRLTGQKRFVAHAHMADLILVAARTGGAPGETAGLTLFAIESKADGLSASPERLVDAGLASRIGFDGVQVDAKAVIGRVDDGWTILSRVLDVVRTGAAAELLGASTRASEITIEYLKSRQQFGQAIGGFQALQHRAAHVYAELEVTRAAVLKAQQLLEFRDPAATQATHVAKAMAGTTAALAVQEAVQMHGGIGMTDAYDIGFYMKRARVLSEMFGDSDFHADQLARLSGY